jgi:hypothetical protein
MSWIQDLDVAAFGRTAESKSTIVEGVAVDAIDSALVLPQPKSIYAVQVHNIPSLRVFDRKLGRQEACEENEPDKQDDRNEGSLVDFPNFQQSDRGFLQGW